MATLVAGKGRVVAMTVYCCKYIESSGKVAVEIGELGEGAAVEQVVKIMAELDTAKEPVHVQEVEASVVRDALCAVFEIADSEDGVFGQTNRAANEVVLGRQRQLTVHSGEGDLVEEAVHELESSAFIPAEEL